VFNRLHLGADDARVALMAPRRWPLVGLLVLAGCGADTHSARPLADLPDDQQDTVRAASDAARDICETIAASLEEPDITQRCTAEAMWSAGSVEQCEMLRDECLSGAERGNTVIEESVDLDACTAELSQELAGCEATAAEVKACASAEVARSTSSAYADVSCDNAGLAAEPADDEPVDEDEEILPECVRLYELCPELLEDAVVEDGGFVCADGTDIVDEYVCDQYADCAGSEDEADCTYEMGPSYGDEPDGGFVCADGTDIVDSWVCDSYNDCTDGDDEVGCPPVEQGDGGFLCQDGFDIEDGWVCDGFPDCSNSEDEADCGDTDSDSGVGEQN
jgi:hypothetical protein